MAASNYELTAAPVTLITHAGTQIANIQCAQCGGRETWRINGRRPPPEILPKHFQQKGWSTRKRPTCPACTIKNKEAQKMNAKVEPLVKAHTPAANSDAARKNKRLVIVALEDYFDEAAKRYRSGKSDEAVAEELSLAPAFVKMVREEFYGKLAEPEDIAQMRDELAKLMINVSNAQKRLADLTQRNGWV